MSRVAISGIGIVSPLGADPSDTWQRVQAGEKPPVSPLNHPSWDQPVGCHLVPRDLVRTYERHPRLRRSSEISHFSAIAGMNALADAGLLEGEGRGEIGVVFAVSSGGVRYTTRFYNDVVTTGAGTASPLLFPETVFNAPASHLAALLGLDGMSYTLVGDSAVGLSALSFAEDLVASGQLVHCVVVAAEEADWMVCEAFRRSRYFTEGGETRPFGGPGRRGTVFSEGAAAIVLSRTGSVEISRLHRGVPFFRKNQIRSAIEKVLRELGREPEVVFAGANGTSADDAEAAALDAVWPRAKKIAPKAALGESVGAGALQQVVLAVQALRDAQFSSTGITSAGYNTLVAGAILQKAGVE